MISQHVTVLCIAQLQHCLTVHLVYLHQVYEVVQSLNIYIDEDEDGSDEGDPLSPSGSLTAAVLKPRGSAINLDDLVRIPFISVWSFDGRGLGGEVLFLEKNIPAHSD